MAYKTLDVLAPAGSQPYLICSNKPIIPHTIWPLHTPCMDNSNSKYSLLRKSAPGLSNQVKSHLYALARLYPQVSFISLCVNYQTTSPASTETGFGFGYLAQVMLTIHFFEQLPFAKYYWGIHKETRQRPCPQKAYSLVGEAGIKNKTYTVRSTSE